MALGNLLFTLYQLDNAQEEIGAAIKIHPTDKKAIAKRTKHVENAASLVDRANKELAEACAGGIKEKKLTLDHLSAVLKEAKAKKDSKDLEKSVQQTIKTLSIPDPPVKCPHLVTAAGLLASWNPISPFTQDLESANKELGKVESFYDTKWEPHVDALEKAKKEYEDAMKDCAKLDNAPLKAALQKVGDRIGGALKKLKRK